MGGGGYDHGDKEEADRKKNVERRNAAWALTEEELFELAEGKKKIRLEQEKLRRDLEEGADRHAIERLISRGYKVTK